jgi:hypothetical protein
MAIRNQIQPDTVTSMPSRSLIFFGLRAYDLLATMNSLFGQVISGEITRTRFEGIRQTIEWFRWGDMDSSQMPNMPCPFCNGNSVHWLAAELWWYNHGIECALEDLADEVAVYEQPDPVVIDLVSDDEEEEEEQEEQETTTPMTNDEIYDVVLAEGVDRLMQQMEESQPAPAA